MGRRRTFLEELVLNLHLLYQEEDVQQFSSASPPLGMRGKITGGPVLKLLVSALKMLHAGVIEQGCTAMAHLAVEDESRLKVATEGGISVVVGAVRMSANLVAPLTASLAALANLSGHATCRQSFLRANIVPDVVRSLQRFGCSAEGGGPAKAYDALAQGGGIPETEHTHPLS